LSKVIRVITRVKDIIVSETIWKPDQFCTKHLISFNLLLLVFFHFESRQNALKYPIIKLTILYTYKHNVYVNICLLFSTHGEPESR
jgi:hypothetical protein